MPTTRRSAANARGRTGPTRGQSTISFSNKVTKDIPKHSQKKDGSPVRTEARDLDEARLASQETPATSQDTYAASQDTYAASQDTYAASQVTSLPKNAQEDEASAAGEIGHTIQNLNIVQNASAPAQDSSWADTELEAENIPDAQIKDYWSAIEERRKAPMVHLEGVDVWEKALRHFDVSSQYGPCIGIPRSKRWRRAQRLGLNPPIEVLAIIQKEAKMGRRDTQTAQMDRIMNATALAI